MDDRALGGDDGLALSFGAQRCAAVFAHQSARGSGASLAISFAALDLVQAGERDAEANRERGLRDLERLEEFLKEHLAGVRRRPHLG